MPSYCVRGVLAGGWTTYGRIRVSATGRGLLNIN